MSVWWLETYLRDPLGWYKRSSFHMCYASLCKPADEFQFSLQRNRALLVLQTISRSDFDDSGMVCKEDT